jgi:predicted GNAT superfamily acetyltransferase
MTNKEAIEILSRPFHMTKVPKDILIAHQMAVKLLKRESILDKIKAEIGQGYCVVNNDYDQGRNYGLYMATQIIDKYKMEGEE